MMVPPMAAETCVMSSSCWSMLRPQACQEQMGQLVTKSTMNQTFVHHAASCTVVHSLQPSLQA